MSKIAMALMFTVMIALGGCESRGGSAALGGVAGVAAGAGGYEYHLNRQKNRVVQDFKDGKIDQREHDIRLDQISRDSFMQ